MNIGIFFKTAGEYAYPFSDPDYIEGYQEFVDEIEKAGGNPYFVRENETYQGGGNFNQSYQLKNKKVITTGPIHIDSLFNKDNFITDDTIPVINHPFVHTLAGDKLKTADMFPDVSPITLLIESAEHLLSSLQKIPGTIKVVKPLDETCGRGVCIGDIHHIMSESHSYPLLAQEFIDTSAGIPGIMEGIHDLRVVVVNGEPVMSYYRTPPKDSLIANVALGGEMHYVLIKDLPKSVLNMINLVDANMKQFGPRVYSVDTAFHTTGVKLIELNAMPGIIQNSVGPEVKQFKQKLAEALVTIK